MRSLRYSLIYWAYKMSGAFNQIRVENLTMAYGANVVMRSLDFTLKSGEVSMVMGASGCGKSTLLKHLIGLERAQSGNIYYGEQRFDPEEAQSDSIRRNFGVLFQSGALWSSLSLAENVAMPLELYTELGPREIAEVVNFKLSLVGLAGVGDRYPSELSGGMRKRAGLARAIALDPKVLFFDEPSAGLDPLSSRRLDELILQIREVLGATIVVVSHELASIFTIADHALYLDVDSKALLAEGKPAELLEDPSVDLKVKRFLRRDIQK